jgi:hypothetical protein
LEATAAVSRGYPNPPFRRLRVYAFDPQASLELETAQINDAVITLPWETPWEDPLTLGPCNDYLEVIDHDPASGLFYAPVDLNDPTLLAQDGLPPSEGRPQFHQQMVFAVAMKTIRLFERALGRPVFWTQEFTPEQKAGDAAAGGEKPRHLGERTLLRRLRIYPHALREANAYYSPEKAALLFGYFKKGNDDENDDTDDEGWVFTCLSQDIVVHETTHAILHGINRRSIEASNLDSLAFHEAFADVIALFQHFTMTDVVAHQIAHSRGSLRGKNLLTGLARQFGEATGRNGSLRYALQLLGDEVGGEADRADEDAAPPEKPSLATAKEPHDRGGFLVAAVFDAFVTIYERRTADLLRIALGQSTPDGRELSPDLVRRLAVEAGKSADHLLRMCVRGLDYLPVTDVHFGEYLRAVITADAELVLDDPLRYRVALAEAFRKRGIFVPGCISMAPDSLVWDPPDLAPELAELERKGELFADLLSDLSVTTMFLGKNKLELERFPDYSDEAHDRYNRRDEARRIIHHNQLCVWRWLVRGIKKHRQAWENLLGLKLDACELASIPLSKRTGLPAIEVHSVRVARRSGPNGEELHQIVIQVTQRRRGYDDEATQERADSGELGKSTDEEDARLWNEPDFWFRGGATLLIDMRDGRLRTVVRKRIGDRRRLERHRQYRFESGINFCVGKRQSMAAREPFAFIHEEP